MAQHKIKGDCFLSPPLINYYYVNPHFLSCHYQLTQFCIPVTLWCPLLHDLPL